jgi:hypothetical protein
MGFEPMISVSEQAKTVHALDASATMSGTGCFRLKYFSGTKRFTDALCSNWEKHEKKKKRRRRLRRIRTEHN